MDGYQSAGNFHVYREVEGVRIAGERARSPWDANGECALACPRYSSKEGMRGAYRCACGQAQAWIDRAGLRWCVRARAPSNDVVGYPSGTPGMREVIVAQFTTHEKRSRRAVRVDEPGFTLIVGHARYKGHVLRSSCPSRPTLDECAQRGRGCSALTNGEPL